MFFSEFMLFDFFTSLPSFFFFSPFFFLSFFLSLLLSSLSLSYSLSTIGVILQIYRSIAWNWRERLYAESNAASFQLQRSSVFELKRRQRRRLMRKVKVAFAVYFFILLLLLSDVVKDRKYSHCTHNPYMSAPVERDTQQKSIHCEKRTRLKIIPKEMYWNLHKSPTFDNFPSFSMIKIQIVEIYHHPPWITVVFTQCIYRSRRENQ